LLVPAVDLEQRAQVNATEGPQGDETLHGLFLRQATMAPDATAVVTAERRLSYGELERRSARLATQLERLGGEPGELVAVVMHKGWEQVVAVLAALRAGAAYLPIDAALPPERQRTLFEQGKVRFALTQPAVDDALEWPDSITRRVVGVDDTEG